MTDGLLRRFFWPALDVLDYWLTLTGLRTLDALAGPETQTAADHQRECDRDRMEKL